jgi:predicted HTH transcriptional regulator
MAVMDNSEGAHYSGEEKCPMPSHEESFNRLQNVAEIMALIGTTEDLHLDCKIWPPNENDAQKILAKALCGFANADGGVVVIGMEAKVGPNRDDPDIIQQARPITSALAVKSRIENLVGQLVEPGLEGVQVATVFDSPGSMSGFVLVDVPATEGFPCRSRKDSKFYLRVSSGTFPMEYFQIADMFGKRRRPGRRGSSF